MNIKLYYNFLTPASRSIYLFLKINKIPFQPILLDITKGQHLRNEIKASRLNQIPLLSINDFYMVENSAMIRYLSKNFSILNNWYPKSSIEQAKIDEFLSWEHHNIGFLCCMYHNLQVLKPNIKRKTSNTEKIQSFKNRLIDCVDKLEKIWLDNHFLIGDNITVADIHCLNDLDQAIIAGYDVTINRPRITSWMERVKMILNPHYKEIIKQIH